MPRPDHDNTALSARASTHPPAPTETTLSTLNLLQVEQHRRSKRVIKRTKGYRDIASNCSSDGSRRDSRSSLSVGESSSGSSQKMGKVKNIAQTRAGRPQEGGEVCSCPYGPHSESSGSSTTLNHDSENNISYATSTHHRHLTPAQEIALSYRARSATPTSAAGSRSSTSSTSTSSPAPKLSSPLADPPLKLPFPPPSIVSRPFSDIGSACEHADPFSDDDIGRGEKRFAIYFPDRPDLLERLNVLVGAIFLKQQHAARHSLEDPFEDQCYFHAQFAPGKRHSEVEDGTDACSDWIPITPLYPPTECSYNTESMTECDPEEEAEMIRRSRACGSRSLKLPSKMGPPSPPLLASTKSNLSANILAHVQPFTRARSVDTRVTHHTRRSSSSSGTSDSNTLYSESGSCHSADSESIWVNLELEKKDGCGLRYDIDGERRSCAELAHQRHDAVSVASGNSADGLIGFDGPQITHRKSRERALEHNLQEAISVVDKTGHGQNVTITATRKTNTASNTKSLTQHQQPTSSADPQGVINNRNSNDTHHVCSSDDVDVFDLNKFEHETLPCPRTGCGDVLLGVKALMYHLHIHDVGDRVENIGPGAVAPTRPQRRHDGRKHTQEHRRQLSAGSKGPIHDLVYDGLSGENLGSTRPSYLRGNSLPQVILSAAQPTRTDCKRKRRGSGPHVRLEVVDVSDDFPTYEGGDFGRSSPFDPTIHQPHLNNMAAVASFRAGLRRVFKKIGHPGIPSCHTADTLLSPKLVGAQPAVHSKVG